MITSRRTTATGRNVLFILAGIAGLLLKQHYHGPFAHLVDAYLGNIAVSFAVYFLLLQGGARFGIGSGAAAAAAFLVTGAFEATGGFGVMANVYDPLDFLANGAGIGIALAVDLATPRFFHRAGS